MIKDWRLKRTPLRMSISILLKEEHDGVMKQLLFA